MKINKFHRKICNKALSVARKKRSDYATKKDPFRNFRAFGKLGVVIRMHDKLVRLENFCKKGKLENESVEDAVIDIINYSVIYLAMAGEEM